MLRPPNNLPPPASHSSYRTYPPELISLGRLLFYDRVLSGTYRVSCATCHNPDRATSNGFLLPTKSDAPTDSLAVAHLPHYGARISSSHAPPLYNLGAHEFSTLFTDGRLRATPTSTSNSYIAPTSNLPPNLNDILAVQSLFPAVSRDELLGHSGDASDTELWDELTSRVTRLKSYRPHFESAYPDLSFPSDITIVEIANALSAFVGYEWRSDNSPFDRYFWGDHSSLTPSQLRGLEIFDSSGCSSCHSGVFQTDHQFHPFAFPPFSYASVLDSPDTTLFDSRTGRYSVTKDSSDYMSFRTPSLRNVTRTAPYGHSGSHADLRSALIYHLDPTTQLQQFLESRSGSGITPENLARLESFAKSQTLTLPPLTSSELDDLIDFLDALTDESNLEGRLGRPSSVPSFLVID